MSRKAESLESIGLLTRINWPAWAPAMCLALQSISAFRVATGEQKKPPASQPPNQLLKDYTSLCNDYDAKDAKERTLIRSHVDENTWFKLKGCAVDASLHQVWTGLVRAYETNFVPFVAIFHSDNGGEFVNNSLKAFFWERVIEHRTTVPYAHYQNGVIERGWRTMFETVRIWLLVLGLPLSFWAFAVTAFTYVSNHRPTAALPGSTPFEMYHLCKPNVSRIRVWSCVAYIRIAPERRPSKIEPPRVKARFIGYAEQGWMFWRPDTNNMFVSDDANFNESSFKLHLGESDEADLREDSPTTLFSDPPTGSLDIDGNDAVEQDFSLDGAG